MHRPSSSFLTLLLLTGWISPALSQVNDLPEALAAVSPRVSQTLHFPLNADALPAGGHLQGVQRMGDGYLLSGSSGTHAYLLDTRPGLEACQFVRLTESPFRHAGGFQVLGDRIIAVGIEDNQRRDRARIWLIDGHALPDPDSASATEFPNVRPLLEIHRKGEEKTSTAGAVALASMDTGHLLIVGSWDSATLDFYRSNGLPLADPDCRFDLRETWSAAEADRDDWADPGYGSYQNIQLTRERDGDWYLGAFCRHEEEDRLDLFALRFDDGVPVTQRLQKRASKRFQCRDTTFLAGGGWHIGEDGRLTVLACHHHRGIVEVFETPVPDGEARD